MEFDKDASLQVLNLIETGTKAWLNQVKYIQENTPLTVDEIVDHLTNIDLLKIPRTQWRDFWRLLTTQLPGDQNDQMDGTLKIVKGLGLDTESKKRSFLNRVAGMELTQFLNSSQDLSIEDTFSSLDKIHFVVDHGVPWLNIWIESCIETGTLDKDKMGVSLDKILDRYANINDDLVWEDKLRVLDFLVHRQVEDGHEEETKVMMIDLLLDHGAAWREMENDTSQYVGFWEQIQKHPRVIKDRLEDAMVKHEGIQIRIKM